MKNIKKDGIKYVCIIPARSKSKRIKNKNIKNFFGKPLIYYSIKLALKSKIFNKVIVSTDSQKIANIAILFGFCDMNELFGTFKLHVWQASQMVGPKMGLGAEESRLQNDPSHSTLVSCFLLPRGGKYFVVFVVEILITPMI